jgi:hypothetical protein
MSRRDIEFLKAQTKRLEVLGIVLGNRNGQYFVCMPCDIAQPLHPHPRRGRKRLYESNAKRQRAYRYRSKSRTVTK